MYSTREGKSEYGTILTAIIESQRDNTALGKVFFVRKNGNNCNNLKANLNSINNRVIHI